MNNWGVFSTNQDKKRRFVISLTLCLILCFAVVQTPFILLQVRNYTWNAETVQNKLTSALETNVRYKAITLKDEMDIISYQGRYLLQSNDVHRYLVYAATLTGPKNFEVEERINKNLEMLAHCSSLIESCELYYPTVKKKFGFYARNVDSGIGSGASRNNAISSAFIESLYAQLAGQFSPLLYENGQLFLLLSEGGKYGQPFYILRINLYQTAVNELLNGYNAYESDGTYLLFWNGDKTVSTDPLAEETSAVLRENFHFEDANKIGHFPFTVNNRMYYAFYHSISSYKLSVVQVVDAALLTKIPTRLRLFLKQSLFITAIMVVVFVVMVRFLLDRPIQSIQVAFQQVGQGDLSVRIAPHATKELDTVANGFNKMVEKLENLINENYQQKILLNDAKLWQLQSQIKPHFLYNSFFMLRHSIQEDDTIKAEKICSSLGNYFRAITRLDREELLLQEEVENTSGYIAIQEMRFANNLVIEQEPLPDGFDALRVPAMILQPLIENAIDYGMTSNCCVLRIRYEKMPNMLLIHIEDNGDKLEDIKLEEMNVALKNSNLGAHATTNIHNRLRLFYGEAGGLTFSRSQLGGCQATLHIPTVRRNKVRKE